MEVIINIKNEEIRIVLKEKDKEIDRIKFSDEHDLTKRLLFSIDDLLKKNKLSIAKIKSVKVRSDMSDSFTTVRIAKITAKTINEMGKASCR